MGGRDQEVSGEKPTVKQTAEFLQEVAMLRSRHYRGVVNLMKMVVRRPNGMKAYTKQELHQHLSEEDEELLAMEIWIAAKPVFKDIDMEYEAEASELVETLFEHSLDKGNLWYVEKMQWLLAIGQPRGPKAVHNPGQTKVRFAEWKATYDELQLVHPGGISEDDAIFSLSSLVEKFGPQMARAQRKATTGAYLDLTKFIKEVSEEVKVLQQGADQKAKETPEEKPREKKAKKWLKKEDKDKSGDIAAHDGMIMSEKQKQLAMDQGICMSFLKGTCQRGDKCKFQHSQIALLATQSLGERIREPVGRDRRGNRQVVSHRVAGTGPVTNFASLNSFILLFLIW